MIQKKITCLSSVDPVSDGVYYETNLFGDPSLKITEGAANHPPEKPGLPNGPLSGNAGVNYTFSSNTTDPDIGDQLYYQWDWENGVSDWLGPYTSGQSVEATIVG